MNPSLFICAYSDLSLKEKFIQKNVSINKSLSKFSSIAIQKYRGNIAQYYNDILNTFSYGQPSWLIFHHETLELFEDITPHFNMLEKNVLYGIMGSLLLKNSDSSYTIESRGQSFEKNSFGKSTQLRKCAQIETGALVDSVSQQCLIVHSSLIEKTQLRFDERLRDVLYIEDFCLNAKEAHNIQTKIIELRCCNWDQVDGLIQIQSAPYIEKLNYLDQKYSNSVYATLYSLVGAKKAEIITQNDIFPKTIRFGESTQGEMNYNIYIPLDDVNNSLKIIYDFVTPNSTILDVGCGTGNLGEILNKNKKCFCYGMEYNPSSLSVLNEKNCYIAAHQVDLNYFNCNDYANYQHKFDYIIFGDILEHLYTPEKVVEAMLNLLKPEGFLLISLPNIAHASIKAALLTNDFSYQDTGVLDRTHIRFYTCKTIAFFLAKNNLIIDDYNYTTFDALGMSMIDPYASFPSEVKQFIFSDEHSFILQYVMKVRHAPLKTNNECLMENKTLQEIDEELNPFLNLYRQKATFL